MMERYYTQSETERLKAQATVIALNHGVRARSYAEKLALLKAKRLKREEIETLRRLSEALGIDYDEIKPIKPEGGGGEVVA